MKDRYAVFDLKTRKFTWKFQRHPQIIALADTFNDINVNFQPQSLIRFEITQDLKVFSFDENLWINNRHVKLPFYSCNFDISPDQQTIAISSGHLLLFIDANSGLTKTTMVFDNVVTDVTYSVDGLTFAVSEFFDNALKIFDVE
jgi:hypothetical protein